MKLHQIQQRLIEAFPGSEVEVTDLTGTKDHIEVVIAAPQFAALPRIQQHQAVMKVFAEELKTEEIHALSIRSKSL